MTNKQINNLIADTLDITNFHETVTGFWGNTKNPRSLYVSYSNQHAAIVKIPDFTESLDAIRKHLEDSMNDIDKEEFRKICLRLPSENYQIFLTPLEKCYAYLIFKGKAGMDDFYRHCPDSE